MTFYRLPKVEAVQRWVDETPEDFVFAVKASRYLTHVKRLREVREGVALLYERIEPLVDAGKLGPILWQLPESFHRDDERLAVALEELEARDEFAHVVVNDDLDRAVGELSGLIARILGEPTRGASQ